MDTIIITVIVDITLNGSVCLSGLCRKQGIALWDLDSVIDALVIALKGRGFDPEVINKDGNTYIMFKNKYGKDVYIDIDDTNLENFGFGMEVFLDFNGEGLRDGPIELEVKFNK